MRTSKISNYPPLLLSERNLLRVGKTKRNFTKRELKPKLGEEAVRQSHHPDMSSSPALPGHVSGVDMLPYDLERCAFVGIMTWDDTVKVKYMSDQFSKAIGIQGGVLRLSGGNVIP